MSNRYVGVAGETTYGTQVNPSRFFEALSETLKMERNFDRIEPIRSYSTRQAVQTFARVTGNVEVLGNYDGLGILYEYLMGSATSVTGAINTHTFPATDGIPSVDRIGKSLTCWVRRASGIYYAYNGMKPVSLVHEWGPEAASKLNFGFLGKGEATATTSTVSPSYPTLLPMSPTHATVNFSGSAIAARSCRISIENPVDEPKGLGSATFVKEPDRSGVLKVMGSFELYMDDLDEYQYYDGVTNVDLQLTATNGTESITYNLDTCRIIQGTPGLSGRDRLIAPFELEAIYTSDGKENCEIILANNDATP